MNASPNVAASLGKGPTALHKPLQDLQGRHAIVTGANAGLGYQTALQLAERGTSVTLACRSPERAAAAAQKLRIAVPGGLFEIATVDMGNLDSVRAFADDCKRRLSQLDFLCNNAGVIGVPFASSPQGFELHMATNYFGPFALTGQLLELLSTTPGSRIVNITSQIHRMASLPVDDLNWQRRSYKPWGAYAQSKLAVAAFTVELERRLRSTGSGVTALLAHPGFSATDAAVSGALARFVGGLFVRAGLVQSGAEGARCSVYAMASPEAKGGDCIGPDNWIGSSGPPARAKPAVRAMDLVRNAALWAKSCEATGVSYL